MTAVERAVRLFVWFIAGFTVVFLMTPLVVMISPWGPRDFRVGPT